MDIQHLIYAVEVHHCGSITKAAQNLFVAQPNLSNAIKELEEELGISIFRRNSRGVETTKEGAEFLQYAQGIIERFNVMKQRYIKQKTDGVSLQITTMRSSLILEKIVTYINDMLEKGQAVKMHFKEATNLDVINDVVSNQADIGIVRANSVNFDYYKQVAESKQLLLQPLPSDCYMILMSHTHPLANESVITPDMLSPYLEVIHGDFEMPWYPYFSNVHGPSPTGIHSRSYLNVYDRGTLLEAVSSIHGAYTWTTSGAPKVLEGHGLISKYCQNYILEGKEAIVYKPTAVMRKEIMDVITYLNTYR